MIQVRFNTWRKLWLHIAIAEKELGLPISDQAIAEMQANLQVVRPRLFHLLRHNIKERPFLSTWMRSSLH
jgi:adenylosuccinate lyase